MFGNDSLENKIYASHFSMMEEKEMVVSGNHRIAK